MTNGSVSHSILSAEKIAKLNSYVSTEMQKRKIPGISLTLVKGDDVVFSRGYGYRDVERSLPATENTLYGIGSVTKSVTAVAILQLSERGKLKLDDPVTNYIEPYKVDKYANKTTVTHMLTHTSGFPTLNAAEILLMRDIGKDGTYIPMTDYADFFDLINEAKDERVSPPGESFFYWNEGYTILGKIIEELTGKEFDQYISENILKPLGMDRSTFHKELALADPDVATPYYFGEGGREPVSIVDNKLVQSPGGLITSSLELSRYLRMWMGSKKYNDGVLNEKSIAEGIKPRAKTNRLGGMIDAFYAFGWMTSKNLFGMEFVSHSGSVGVSSGFLGFVPELGIGVSIGSNHGETPTSQIGSYALSLLMDGKDPSELQFVKNSAMRKKLIGSYEDFRGYSKARIFVGEDGLMNMTFQSDEMKYTLPLIIEGDEVYTIINDLKMPVLVKHGKNNSTEVFLERHRMVKI